MSAAVMRVSSQLLREALHLPADCEILGSLSSDDADTVDLLVCHDTITTETIEVAGIYRSIHGVSVFDRFDVAKTANEAKLV